MSNAASYLAAAISHTQTEPSAQALDPVSARRREALGSALSAVGLTIRDDSKLAQSYIADRLQPASEWSLDRVILELCSTHYLYNYTNYQQLCKTVYESLVDATEDPPFSTFLVQRHIAAKIKIKVLSEQPIPTNGDWPWLSEVKTSELVSPSPSSEPEVE